MYSEFFQKFKKNKRGYLSFLILSTVFFLTLFSEIIANDKPLVIKFKNDLYYPIFQKIPETKFGGTLKTEADYRDPEVKKLIKENGWIISAPIPFFYDTINYSVEDPAPSRPTTKNFFGTDDQGRDVLTRLLYGIRISLIFGIILSSFTLLLATFLGAVQGYFGGLIDLFFQRFIEIWSSMPVMFLLITLSAVIVPTFLSLLIIMLLFSWMGMVSYVRAEFLRLRNFDFVRASKSLGASNSRIIFSHILPNSAPVIFANLPFLLSSAITTLTALDFLGLGLQPGMPSIGEMLSQGKNNLSCYWLGVSSFLILTIILMSLVFIGEALRDSFDSRK